MDGIRRTASARDLLPGDPRRVGPYELESKLGEGGMGAVYLGRARGGEHAGRLVAVKVVRSQLADDPAFRRRFRDEVVNAERVASFCTAQVLDHGEDAGRAYMVTEYIDGPSLLQHVADNGALSAGMLHGVAVGVAAALVAIHASGLVHRDLKPSNVLLSISGPRVIDFGIARALDMTASLTQTGQVVGSPGWIAPEQILNQGSTTAVDLFAWGCLVAFAGTGRHPFGTGTFQVLAARVVHAEPDLDGLPEPLAALVRSALSKEPAHRPTAQDLLLRLVGGSGEAAVTTTLGQSWPDPPAAPPAAPHPRHAAPERLEPAQPGWQETPPGRHAPTSPPDEAVRDEFGRRPPGTAVFGDEGIRPGPPAPPGDQGVRTGQVTPPPGAGEAAGAGARPEHRPPPAPPPGGASPPRSDASPPPSDASLPPGHSSPPRGDASPLPGGASPPRGDASLPPGDGSPPRLVGRPPVGGAAAPAGDEAVRGEFAQPPAGRGAGGVRGAYEPPVSWEAGGAVRDETMRLEGTTAGRGETMADRPPMPEDAQTAPRMPGGAWTPGAPTLGSGERPRGRNLLLYGGVAAGVAALVAGGALALNLRGGPDGGGKAAAGGLPGDEMLVRVDTARGWPDECHAKIGLLKPGAGAARTLLPGSGCDMLPQWSPDRRRVAFTRWTGGATSQVYVMNADGSGAQKAGSDIIAKTRVAWSPDGTRLAAMVKVGGIPQLHVSDLLSGNTVKLTGDQADKADPTWSKDGRIAFWSKKDGSQQIYYLNPDDPAKPTRLTTAGMAPDGANDPRWSPDGRTMAFTLQKAGGANDIAVIGADGRGFRKLTDDPDRDMDPNWSPDGRWLSFVRGPVDTPQIFAVRADGSGRRAVGPRSIGHPAWS